MRPPQPGSGTQPAEADPGPTCRHYIRPPLQIIQRDPKAEFCYRVFRASGSSNASYTWGKMDGTQRYHLGLDSNLCEMFNGAYPAHDPAAVADNRHRLVSNAKETNTLSMAFFSTAGTEWLYSGVMTR